MRDACCVFGWRTNPADHCHYFSFGLTELNIAVLVEVKWFGDEFTSSLSCSGAAFYYSEQVLFIVTNEDVTRPSILCCISIQRGLTWSEHPQTVKMPHDRWVLQKLTFVRKRVQNENARPGHVVDSVCVSAYEA